jgi:type IV secretory pathway VirB10-like protein
MPGQPPNPMLMQLQQVQQALQAPRWADVLALLRDDLSRAFRIDIETNSTVEPEAAEDHQAIQELMMALGQTIQGLTPLVVSGSLPFQAVQNLLLFIARRFRFGSEIEDSIKAMQPPKPPDQHGAEQVKQQTEMAKQDIQMKQKEAESAIKSKDMDHQMNVKQREMQLQMKEMDLAIRELQAKHEQGMAKMELKMGEQMAGKNIQMKSQDAAFKVKQAQQQAQQKQQAQQQQQRRTA